MKVRMTFMGDTHDNEQEIELLLNATWYASALEKIAKDLRDMLKYREISPDQRAILEEFSKNFWETVEGYELKIP